MFKHILVPLDGSNLAETVLPAAVRIAEMAGAVVTLLHVIERDAPQEIHGQRHLREPGEAAAYLDEVAARAFPPGMRVNRHVHTTEVDNVPRGIALHVGELEPDLIVMCTHGSGGFHDLLFGRIAHQVVKLGTRPVLLINPPADGSTPVFACGRLLVPLDGNPGHEQGLTVAADLARACGAELQLVMVVPLVGDLSGAHAATARMLPGATAVLLDLAEREAQDYLDRHVAALRCAGLTVAADVARGDAATDIVGTAKRTKSDVIVMATHGRTGLDAFWSGSATRDVVGRATVPLLLVPAPEPEER